MRRHAGGVLLAISAPADQLLLATEVNEWALCAALAERDPARWASLQDALVAAAIDDADPGAELALGLLPVMEEGAALARFKTLSAIEAAPKRRALIQAASDRSLPYFADDAELTLGAGSGSRTFTLERLPAVAEVPWGELSDIPTALVTGSNGKTTTVRLVAACAVSWPVTWSDSHVRLRLSQLDHPRLLRPDERWHSCRSVHPEESPGDLNDAVRPRRDARPPDANAKE